MTKRHPPKLSREADIARLQKLTKRGKGGLKDWAKKKLKTRYHTS